MALFLDGAVSTTGDLTAQDSQLLDVASTEGIDLGSKLALAQEELGVELRGALERGQPMGPVRLARAGLCRSMGIRHVVVTPPLKMWHTFRTLETVYRERYNNELNDRYAGKRDAFHEMAAWAREKLILLGIGMAWNPVPRAETPAVRAGAGIVGGRNLLCDGGVGEPRGRRRSERDAGGTTTTGGTLAVQPGATPEGATGWNVYMGVSADGMTLQNASLLAPGQSWTQPPRLTTAGRKAGSGQAPSYLWPAPRLLQRG